MRSVIECLKYCAAFYVHVVITCLRNILLQIAPIANVRAVCAVRTFREAGLATRALAMRLINNAFSALALDRAPRQEVNTVLYGCTEQPVVPTSSVSRYSCDIHSPCHADIVADMVGSGAPAKRLRYSPESLYAPQSRIQLDATTVPFSIGTTPNKGTFSAAAVKSAADVQQSRMDRPHAASEHGHRLNASAIPWQPFSGFFGEQQSGISSGFGWQAGFDHAHADNEQLGSTPDKRAEEIVKHVFEDVAQQVRMAYQSRS